MDDSPETESMMDPGIPAENIKLRFIDMDSSEALQEKTREVIAVHLHITGIMEERKVSAERLMAVGDKTD